MIERTILKHMKRKLTGYLNTAPLSEAKLPAKLAWLYIAENGEDAYTVRGVADALNLGSVQTARLALDDLHTRGLLTKLEEGKGRRATRYKANYPDGLERPI